MAELNVCGCLAARTAGGSDGPCRYLLENGRVASFWGMFAESRLAQQAYSCVELRGEIDPRAADQFY